NQRIENNNKIELTDKLLFRVSFVTSRFNQHGARAPHLEVVAKRPWRKRVVILGNTTRNVGLQKVLMPAAIFIASPRSSLTSRAVLYAGASSAIVTGVGVPGTL